ncbi:hypothetical protein NQ317_004089 [Molorchus minor]|uniref:Uncharacterized protein n=1 Tax=Molorchus minor TaxID=1323400 RepID=A0ABQ9JVU0_9CUCU|nr:hypothetical protein NQ317_004089 [Molorchus minor]
MLGETWLEGLEIFECLLSSSNRYLASGNSFGSLAFNFRLGESTIKEIIYSTCEAIWIKLQSIDMPEPDEDM